MTLTKSKWMFAGVWLGGAGAVFAILVIQSLVGRYGDHADQAWAWYLPTVMPTLSLIIGVLVSDFRSGQADGGELPQASGALLWLGLALSVFYLLLVAVSILVQPFLQDVAPLELMHRSNLWLGPLQGLTVGVLAAFFRSG